MALGHKLWRCDWFQDTSPFRFNNHIDWLIWSLMILREYETVQVNRIYHAYLFVYLSKKTYKGATYHNRKSSLCHNRAVRVHWARRRKKLTVRREAPEKSKIHQSCNMSKFLHFYKSEHDEKPISTFKTKTRISFFQSQALRRERESRLRQFWRECWEWNF